MQSFLRRQQSSLLNKFLQKPCSKQPLTAPCPNHSNPFPLPQTNCHVHMHIPPSKTPTNTKHSFYDCSSKTNFSCSDYVTRAFPNTRLYHPSQARIKAPCNKITGSACLETWTVRGSIPGGDIFPTCPDRPWGLLYNEYSRG